MATPMMRAILGVLFTFMATVFVAGWCDYVIQPADIAKATCQEDEPCWDCASMGNHVCGVR